MTTHQRFPIGQTRRAGHGRVKAAPRAVPAPATGFTLIEVLVVIAIIAVLASIIFPVFSSARAKARSTRCVANLKQIGLAVEMYATDYDELYPLAKDPADEFCPGMWDDFPHWQVWIPYMPRLHDALDPYVRNRELWHCPSDRGFTEIEDSNLPLDATPTSFAAFGTSYHYRTEVAFSMIPVGSMSDPAKINLIFDGHGSWHGRSSKRSRKRWNILYADGHAKTANFSQWTEAWNTPLAGY
jgi:prepilin-type N-terminal cleavage/methylation domain-containing protein/prepilin-type processing-associated H-X9-DG protein